MKIKQAIVASLMAITATGLSLPSAAADSVGHASAASVGSSLVAGSVVGWTAFHGSEFTVKAIEASGDSVVLVLQGASGAVETSAKIAGDVAQAASVGIGTSVKVVALSTGYALFATSVLIAFVPNAIGRNLLHHERH